MNIFIEFLQTTMVVFVVLIIITLIVSLNKKRINKLLDKFWYGE